MLSLFTLLLAMTTMLGFWGLAWWLLKQPVLGAFIEPRPARSQWRNEPTGGQMPAPDVSAPRPRIHDDSDSTTQFFTRADLPSRAKIAEKTEILQDQPSPSERTAAVTSPKA